MKHHITIILLLISCAAFASKSDPDQLMNQDRMKVKPLFDTPLRDTHILRAPDGVYYMTGTLSANDQGIDFQNNAGIRLWKSSDLKNWQNLGRVWDLDEDGKSAWLKDSHIDPANPEKGLVRGVAAPEILYVKNNYYIAFSMNGHGCGLLKSASGKPEGPYEEVGQITTSGGDPSLFEDKDGSVYFIWGQGRIAKMNDDLTKITGETRNLLANIEFDMEKKYASFGTNSSDPVRPYGFRVQLRKGKKGDEYLITFAAENCRFGRSLNESFTLHTDKLDGKLAFPRLAVSNSGQNTIFQDDKDKWFGTFSGADDLAEFRDRPAIVPLESNHHGNLTNRRSNFFTMRGPWDTIPFCRPELPMNDAMILAAPDGYYYLAGSNTKKEFLNQVMLYRSKDLKTWTCHKVFDFMDVPWVVKVKEKYPEFLEKKKNHSWYTNGGGAPMSQEIHYLNGKYYMVFVIFMHQASNEIRKYAQEVHGGKTCVIIASDQALGPYKYHSNIGCSMPSFLQDDDPPSSTDSGATGGTIYMTMGCPRKMKPDMTGFLDERSGRKPQDMQKEGLFMSYDPIGSYMLKIGGKYIFGSENCYGGYDGQYWVGDSPTGPWSRPRVHMPHGGHAGMFKGHDPAGSGTGGKYYAVMWHAFKKFSPTAVPLHVEVTKDDVIIMPEYEWEYIRSMK